MLDPVHRREFLAAAAGLAVAAKPAPKKIAAAVTAYAHNFHADLLVGPLLQSYTLDDKGERPDLQLVSLHVDQRRQDDLSVKLARKYGFRLAPTIADALTLGGKDLAVDGVMLIAEQGKYPANAKEQTLYPRRRFFEETTKVFEQSGRVVPVFTDKHLATTWEDSKWLYDTARRLKVPLMAGSSIPITWRHPPLDTPADGKLQEIVGISYHTLDTYGFHGLEMVQCLAERRKGGETGVAAVRCVEGKEVWKLGEQGKYDRRLLDAALAACEQKGRYKGKIEDAVPNPVAFLIEYRDGLKSSVLTLNYAVGEWAAAWREAGRAEPQATVFWTQEYRPLAHFTVQLQGIEKMFHTGQPTWPVERTLLTTGMLDALLTSRVNKGTRIETPHLNIAYRSTFNWKQPPPPPADRPLQGP